jgi:hypothetical protein
MRVQVKNLLKVTLPALALAGPISPTQASAQTYPIDCAILLCLSGGWPASVPCARARAEFIRRITPWPVEPPLQIWRCPMGASFEGPPMPRATERVIEALFRGAEPPANFSSPVPDHAALGDDRLDLEALNATRGNLVMADYALHLAQDRADIDISGPEFNFVRSIRVFDVRHAWQRESGQDGDCNRSATVVLGSYGTQGEFSWSASSPAALPAAHVGLEGWGEHCPGIWHRSVFVEWRDYSGTYGFEQVNY